MKVRIKTIAAYRDIYYDVQYKAWNLIWVHYTRCTNKDDAIKVAKGLEKIPKIYSSWQELEAQDKES